MPVRLLTGIVMGALFAGSVASAGAPSAAPAPLVVTTDHFVVQAADAAWANRTSELLEGIYAQFYSDFRAAGFAPSLLPGRLNWLCFADRAAFDRYARECDRMDAAWLEDYYSARTNRVAMLHPLKLDRRPPAKRARTQTVWMDAGAAGFAGSPIADDPDGTALRKASHEAAHQLAFNSGIQKRGVMYPLWVSEGLATNFEFDDWGRCGLGQENPLRRRLLVCARAQGAVMPLADFVTLADAPGGDMETAEDVYAQAWGLFNFLLAQRRDELNRYVAGLAALPVGRRSGATLRAEFTRAFGDVGALQASWERYLDTIEKSAPAGKPLASAR